MLYRPKVKVGVFETVFQKLF